MSKNKYESAHHIACIQFLQWALFIYNNIHDAEFSGDKQLWKVSVTLGSDAITELNVSVNGKSAAESLISDTVFNGEGDIVFGVVLNGIATDVQTFIALVNGDAVDTTVE